MSAGASKQPGPSGPRRGLDRQWMVGAQVALAALLFMAITLLSQMIVTRGLALIGMRTDVASIIAIEACGQRIPAAPASVVDAGHEDMRVEACRTGQSDPKVKVIAAAPSGQSVSLIVNGGRSQIRQSAAARVAFDNVRLHPGDNRLGVAVGERNSSDLQFQEVIESYSETKFGLLRNLPVGGPIIVSMPRSESAARIIGGAVSPGGALVLASGPPDSSARVAGLGDVWFGQGGFAVAKVKALPPGIPALAPGMFRRSARVTRLSSGEFALSADACLPEDSALAQWARAGMLTANDFFLRLTDLRIDPVQLGPTVESGHLSTSLTPTCRIVRSLSTAPISAASRWRGSMLSTPFDSLEFQNFGDRLIFSQLPSSRSPPDLVTFTGQWTDDIDDTLHLDPDIGVLVSEVNAAQKPAPSPAPSTSRLAASWSRAEGGLPSWLRALLSGIAAVAPVLVLLFAIRRSAPAQQTVVAERTEVLAGLDVLLLLALGAAAQPFLFQLFFRVTSLLQVWELLGEVQGSSRWVYPNPYAPVAVAIALMLAPLLRALRNHPGRKQSPFLLFACLSLSLVAVAALFALALAQRLPWHRDDDVWPMHLLESYGVILTPAATLPIMAAALIVALTSAWIPLFWAFHSLAPRRGFLGASILAGSAAILLPLLSYAIEAGRLLLGHPESSRFSSDPSLLALLGGSLLPFALFLALLLVFRSVIMIAVTETERQRALGLLRTRNLVAFAALLTLPRLALDQAAIAPSDMGVIDILSIFQSFGLVAAVLLAISLLRTYSPFVPGGASVGEPLRPFAFGPGELDILAALFAGYLAMWTSGFLATAVAVVVGWPIFKRLVVEPQLSLPGELATPALASALVDFRRNLSLFDARGKQLEARYTGVESDFAALTAERKAIESERQALEHRLGMSANEAKRRLLEFGPEPTPFANGLRGALAGLGFALLLQLATSIFGVDTNAPLTSWADLARKALADPVYSIAPTGSQAASATLLDVPRVATPDLLLFVGALINACFPWVLLGFIFGFAFHQIRGDDGVIKGLVLASAVATAYAFSQLFASGNGIRLMRVIPVFLFLLLVGVTVFDATSLKRRKLSPTQLGDVYGFRTSVGYASLIGAVAAVAPILKFISGFFAKG